MVFFGRHLCRANPLENVNVTDHVLSSPLHLGKPEEDGQAYCDMCFGWSLVDVMACKDRVLLGVTAIAITI